MDKSLLFESPNKVHYMCNISKRKGLKCFWCRRNWKRHEYCKQKCI